MTFNPDDPKEHEKEQRPDCPSCGKLMDFMKGSVGVKCANCGVAWFADLTGGNPIRYQIPKTEPKPGEWRISTW